MAGDRQTSTHVIASAHTSVAFVNVTFSCSQSKNSNAMYLKEPPCLRVVDRFAELSSSPSFAKPKSHNNGRRSSETSMLGWKRDVSHRRFIDPIETLTPFMSQWTTFFLCKNFTPSATPRILERVRDYEPLEKQAMHTSGSRVVCGFLVKYSVMLPFSIHGETIPNVLASTFATPKKSRIFGCLRSIQMCVSFLNRYGPHLDYLDLNLLLSIPSWCEYRYFLCHA